MAKKTYVAKPNDAEYTLGIYKQRYAALRKFYDELKENETAWKQTVDVCMGIVAAGVKKVGTVELTQEEINEAMKSVQVIDDYNAETKTHTLKLREGSEQDGGKDTSCEQG